MLKEAHGSKNVSEYSSTAVTSLRCAVRRLPNCLHYSVNYIANMEQTMAEIDQPATTTSDHVGVGTLKIQNIRCARRGYTVAMAPTASRPKPTASIILRAP
ncbi:hypothetical protein HPB48_000981 [Haemaphysalis longicornis]|uniref:Uncharacterized protein n=1 Tax=Haemaphysalis longicornis TaxID=44386 RepID=A0A9J6GXF1_HAELO|nr:hypothetical protein HPB48_000981 [Haemaphysalis longicornis]